MLHLLRVMFGRSGGGSGVEVGRLIYFSHLIFGHPSVCLTFIFPDMPVWWLACKALVPHSSLTGYFPIFEYSPCFTLAPYQQ
jgi:hypothetical protein